MNASRLLLALDDTVPLLHISVALPLGSLSDPPGKEGTMRLLLRLLRRSAGGRSASVCDELLDGLGSSLSGDVGRSVAAVHGSVISRNAAAFLDFLHDVLTAPSFDEQEFERIRREAQAQLSEVQDDDGALVRRFWVRRFFHGHPYARLSSGTLASVGRITLADLREQYERVFRRGQLVVAASGSGDQAVLTDWLGSVDQALADGRVDRGELGHPEGVRGRVLQFVDKPDRTQTQILIGCLGTHPSDADHIALHVGQTIFGGTFGARLSQEVRAKRGWSYGASSSLPFDRARQAFTMWTFPKATDAAPCIRLQLQLLEKLVQKGVSQKELSSAKKYLKNSHVFTSDTPGKRASLLLDAATYDLPPHYHDEFLSRVHAVSKADIQDALRTRLSPAHLLVSVVGTHAEIGAAVEDSVEHLHTSEVVRFDQGD